jgi:replicative DNA helicase
MPQEADMTTPLQPLPPRPSEPGFDFKPIDSATFAAAVRRQEWLVEGVLASDQPGVIGGPKKSLKTSVAVDLALSIGSGKPFLGKFPVPQKVRVAVLSGESGTAALQETARRVCKAKGVSLTDCDVLWQTELPQLGNAGDRQRLQAGLTTRGVKLVIIDPLYLCLLGGAEKVSASNLFEVGPLLLKVGRACLDAGATPLLLHHATKSAAALKKGEPLDLEDLAFAGIGEFARQWMLLGRREPFQPGTGSHALTLAVGGSAGQSSVWQLDVEEGVLGADGKCRRWAVRVSAPAAAGRAERPPAGGPHRQGKQAWREQEGFE